MKSRLLVLALVGCALPALADPPDQAAAPDYFGAAQPAAVSPSPKPPPVPGGISVVGKWLVQTPNWNDMVVIRPDGTFARCDAGLDTGKWTLITENGQIVLQLEWDKWGSQSLTLLNPDVFGGPQNGGRALWARVTGLAATFDPNSK